MPGGGGSRRGAVVLGGAGLAVVLTGALAGCSQEADSGLPQFSAPPSGAATASATVVPPTEATGATGATEGTTGATTAGSGASADAPSAAAAPVQTVPVVEVLGTTTGVLLVPVPAGVDPAVVQAWYDYLQLRVQALSTRELDTDRLGAVATGFAVSDLIGAVQERVADGTRDVGTVTVDVRGVDVQGTTAVLYDCLGVQAGLVDDAGTPLELPAGATPLRVSLERTPDGWVVVSYSADEGCRPAPDV